eukprot:COSAG05_NODE_21673_length_270_cov_0.608187_1_plen_76_part_10
MAWSHQPKAINQRSLFDILPPPILARVLLSSTAHADLLRHLNVCARVHPDWWHIARSSAAYGNIWPKYGPTRAKTL